MKKSHILLFSFMVVALAMIVVVTWLPASVEADTHHQSGDEIDTQATSTYLTIAGETFVPDSSSTAFAWQSGGGLAVTGASDPLQPGELLGLRAGAAG